VPLDERAESLAISGFRLGKDELVAVHGHVLKVRRRGGGFVRYPCLVLRAGCRVRCSVPVPRAVP
jgi:hypothetical protein